MAEAKACEISDGASRLECPPINLIYSHYHNAIRSELSKLTVNTNDLETLSHGELVGHLQDLKTQFRFLEKIYKYHSSVEDEVVYPALNSKVRNVTSAYSVEHVAEERLFEQLTPLVDDAMAQRGRQQSATIRQLVCKVEEIQQTLRKHLAKEEDQLFPLLLKHFTFAEQAELVAQFLCCIPLAGIEALLTWLKPAVPQEEQDQLLAHVRGVVPDQLLLQMLVSWLGPLPENAKKLKTAHGKKRPAAPLAKLATEDDKPAVGAKKHRPPLKEILYLHAAIRTAMEAFTAEARALQKRGGFTSAQLGALVDRHRFLRSVCTYHQASEDQVLFPAAKNLLSQRAELLAGCHQCEAEHRQEGSTWENLGRLLNDVRACARRGAREVAGLMSQLCDAAESACRDLTSHMQREELQVLPILEEQLGHAEQRSMVWETLKEMPLRLLERVMPWLAGKLSDEDVHEMLSNMELAAPEDSALVQLLSRWAKRGRRPSPEPQDQDDPSTYGNHTCDVKGSNHKRPRSHSSASDPTDQQEEGDEAASKRPRASHPRPPQSAAPAAGAQGGGVGSSHDPDSPRINPIDHIFQFHKALKRELNFMESEALRFAAALETASEGGDPAKLTSQLEGRFRFLWGIYRAHSEAEDEIVFPALEAKEALINVSHAYTLDHQHENELFAEVEQVFSKIRGNTDLVELRTQAAKLQRMCAAMRATLFEHVTGEEQELWPLFAENFSVEEQQDIVGMIIGRTGAEVLQAMLPWVTVSFTEPEQRAMMDSFRSASKNTMFDQWLDATKIPPPAPAGAAPPQSAPQAQEGASGPARRAPELQDLMTYLVEDSSGKVDPHTAQKAREVKAAIDCSSGAQPAMGGVGLTEAGSPSMPATDAAVGSSDIELLTTPNGGTFKPGWQDIFRMNQKQLEIAVRGIQNDSGLDAHRKAYLMQNIMASRYIVAQQNRVNQLQAQSALSAAAGNLPAASFHDAATCTMGCMHYKRKCQIVADCCDKVYPCRHCHDDVEDHRLEPRNVTQIVCMTCSLKQPISAECTGCKTRLGRYYCSICRLWDDQEGRSIYHCPFCNLCRRGQGLGIDACHCMHCNTCMHLSEFKQHTCRNLSACPICTEVLFDSNQPYRELQCGHFMHSHCFAKYTRYNYTCPTCSKSLGDMSVYFRMVDSLVAMDRTTLPPAYRDRKQAVLCNDCERKGETDFHFVYHKCPHCASYNTRLV